MKNKLITRIICITLAVLMTGSFVIYLLYALAGIL